MTKFKDRSKFLELPYSVGDNIYYFNPAGVVYFERSDYILILNDEIRIGLEGGLEFQNTQINKRFFLSLNEAKQAFKEKYYK